MVAAGKGAQSRQTRIAGALVMALLGLWVLTLYGMHLLHQDHQRQGLEQQRATLAMAVRTIERDVAVRQAALAVFAANLTPATLADRALLRQVLDRQEALAGLFPNGLTVMGVDGVPLATTQAGRWPPPQPPGALTLAAPLRDAAGTTIGVVSGSIDAESPGLRTGITLPQRDGLGALLLLAGVALTLLAGFLLWSLLRRKQALTPAARPERDQPYRALLEALPEAVVISRRGLRLYANPAAARLLGADSPAEMVGQSIFDLLSPDSLADLMAQRDLFHGVNEPFLLEVQSRKRDGTVFDAEIRGTPIRYQNQHAILTVTRDVTARKTMEGEWRKLSLAVDQTSHSVLITDTAGRIEYVNEAFVQASGYGRGSVLGRDLSFLKSGKTPSETYRSMWVALADGRTWTGEFVNRRSDGREYIDAAIITPLRRPDGSVSHYVAVQQDVTERVQMLEELRQHRDELECMVSQRTAELTLARQQADLANNAKSRFLAAASHDLRQPLAALALYVGILKRTDAPPGADLVDRIEHCVNQLSELLTDLLDVSKLDAGVVTPRPIDFVLTDALRPLLSIYDAKAQDKGLRLRTRVNPATVRTDVQWLSRIVGNLLDNAIEYTPQGGVLVACRRHQGRQWLEVWDSGVGIAADQTSVVFEEFRQLGDQARTHGSGLGLTIVAKSAALLGLQLRLRSRPGRGSMFAIELPPGQAPVPVQEPLALVPLAERMVVVVDDNPQVLAALTAAIGSMGPKVIAASSGAQLTARLAGQVPDLVVSDYRLANGETGLEVIERLRSAVGWAVPGIIVTGDTDPATVRSMSQHGIAILYKPLKIDCLRAALQRALAAATQAQA